MESPPSPTHSQGTHSDLNHSAGEVLRERAGIPENAPRIKIGAQYYHVVRIIGGRYEAPLSNERELEKATRIGEVFFSAHKKFAKSVPELADKHIDYINEEGIHYEGGKCVANETVQVDGEDSIHYLKASDNYEWQQQVLNFEQKLDTLKTDQFSGNIPPFLDRYAMRRGQRPYTVQQVKEALLDYTRDKLLAAHEIYTTIHSSPEKQQRKRNDEKAWLERHPTATIAIQESRDYFQAGCLKTNHLWKMMVRSMQPQEFRLLPAEEPVDHLLDEDFFHSSSSPIDVPRKRAQSVDLFSPKESASPLSHHRMRSASFTDKQGQKTPPPTHFRAIESPEKRRKESTQPDPLASHKSSQQDLLKVIKGEEEPRQKSTSYSPLKSPDFVHRPGTNFSLSSSTDSGKGSSIGSSFKSSTLDLNQDKEQHPIEVVDRPPTDSQSTSYIPPRENDQRSSTKEEEWFEIDLSSPIPSRRPSVVVPFVNQHARKTVSKSPIPRGVQESSFKKAPRKLKFYEEEDFRKKAALYPQLKMIARNAPPYEWSNRLETQATCRSALEKMERNAAVSEYTALERNAIKYIIQMKESAGGFGLLMAGDQYQSVKRSFSYYARTGLI